MLDTRSNSLKNTKVEKTGYAQHTSDLETSYILIELQLVANMWDTCVNKAMEDGRRAVIAQELAQLAVANMGGMLVCMMKLVKDASMITQTLVGWYPRVPVFVFTGLLYAYAAFAAILFLSTVACTLDMISLGTEDDSAKLEKIGLVGSKPRRPYTALKLAQRRLVNLMTVIAE